MKLKRKFYTRGSTEDIAKRILGKYIIRKWRGRKIIGKIVETEAYIGPEDKASHAYLGKRTKRNKAEYLIGGHVYIYLVYGVYWQLNISTKRKGRPECVLIRAVEPVIDKKSHFKAKDYRNLTNGPGKLCSYLRLDNSFYGEDLTKSKNMWLEEGIKVKKTNISLASRIGIDYAGSYWSRRKLRFFVKNNPFVSKR
jgi:DNA-3-methyladenine glycosylase